MSKKRQPRLSLASAPHQRAPRYAWLLASVASFALTLTAHANPEGGTVSGGSASITTTPKTVDIHQSTNRAIIDWRSFDIAPDETTQFHQPTTSSVTLNRVNSANPSTIAGNLQANGNVILVNPNGVFFSKSARVDVNGLVATTADIDNSSFMAGSTTFNRPGNPDASIINQGSITAREAGLVGLVAPQVENSGTISARLGRIALSSGDTTTLDLYGDGLVSVAVSDAVHSQLVQNTGSLTAEGGTVQLSAAAGRQIVDSLISVSGEVAAPTVGTRQGRVVIQAAPTQSTTNSRALVDGHVSAAGRNAGERGGQIDVLADDVGLLSGAHLDASGAAGGGTVHIGGDYQGTGTTQRAQHVIMQSDVTVDVSAGHTGNGGRAIVWADDWTQFAGFINARGGSQSGDGGFVETSGKQTLMATGTVDAFSPQGKAGLWLLDPNSILIQSSGVTSNLTGSPNFSTTNDSAVLTVASILAALNSGTPVTVMTGTSGANTQVGNITVASSITKTSGGDASLSLIAHRDIIINSGVSISSTSGQMAVTLNADRDANGTGAIALGSGSSIRSNGGDIVLGGGTDPLTTAARGHSANTTAINLNNATLDAAGGNISLRGIGYNGTTYNHGVLLQGGSKLQTTGSGTVTIAGTGGSGATSTTSNRGVYLTGTNTAVTTVNGAISITGTGGGTALSNEGILVNGGALMSATGTGNITLTGHAGGTTLQGLYLTQPSLMNTILSNGGTVTLRSNQGIQLGNTAILSPTAQAFNLILNSDLDASTGGFIGVYGSSLLTSGGNITLGGGADPTAYNAIGMVGSDDGIIISTSTLNAAGGNISLRGTGLVNTAANNIHGVVVTTGGQIITRGTGSISLSGLAGVGNLSNYGIVLTGTGASLTAENGSITLDGTSRGIGTDNNGVGLLTGATVTSTGTASITFNGQGSTTGTAANRGVILSGTGVAVTTADGAVNITGTAGGTTTSNEGIFIGSTAKVISTGTGALTLTGHAGGTSWAGINIYNGASTATILSAGGAVTLRSNQGLALTKSHILSSGGQAFTITLNADLDGNSNGRIGISASNLLSSGGNIILGGGSNPLAMDAVGVSGAIEGINISSASILDAAGGNVSLRGTGLSTATANNHGILLQGGTKVQTSGNGTITMTGTGGNGTSNNRGLNISGVGTAVTAENGLISLSGAARGTSSSNEGLLITGGATVNTTGTGGMTLSGTAAGTSWAGVYLYNATNTNALYSAGGTITLRTNDGIQLTNSNILSSGGQAFNAILNSDADANGDGRIGLSNSQILSSGGNIILGGGSDPSITYAAGRSGAAEGINLSSASILNAAGGNISLRGTGFTTGSANNYGVIVQSGSKVLTTGSGSLSLTGIGGAGTTNNRGVYLTGAGTALSSRDGNIDITASSLGTTASNESLLISGGATVTATGSGNMTLTGQASGTSWAGILLSNPASTNTLMSSGGAITLRSNHGIQISYSNILSGGGAITLNSDRDATGTGRIGVTASSLLSSGGSITLGGGLDPLIANAVGQSGAIEGVNLNLALLNAAGGNISIRGTGFSAGTTSNHGILMQAGAKVQTSGSGTITLNGTGGNGTNGNTGLYITGTNTAITTENGTATLVGTGGGTGSSNAGIVMAGAATINSTGSGAVNITGQASTTATTSSNRGIYLTGIGSAINTVNGAVTLTGTGTGTTTSNEGILVTATGIISSTGTGAITLTGHAGGTGIHGVLLSQTAAMNTILSAGGSVTLRSNQTVHLTNANITSPTGQAFNITLNSDLDANGTGRIALSASNLLSSGGNIIMGGGLDPTTGYAVGVSGGIEGIYAYNAQVNAGGGSISMRGQGFAGTLYNYGVLLSGSAKVQTAGSGTIAVTGIGGNASSTSNHGIVISGAGTTVSSGNGAINLTGSGAGLSWGNGIYFDSAASVTATGNAPISFTGTTTASGSYGYYTNTGATAIGGAGYSGDITINANNASWGTLTIRTTGTAAFRPTSANTTIGVAGAAGTLGITNTLLNNTTAGNIAIGRSDGTGTLTVNARTWTAPVSLSNGNGNIVLNGAQVMGARSFNARTYGTGDIIINSGSSITSTATGTAITLASGHNFNSAGGIGALYTPLGRWLVYSTDPANNTLTGLTAHYRRFSCTPGGSCPAIPSTGNGFLYSMTPMLTITPDTLAAIIYGDASPDLSNYTYHVSGYLDGDAGTDTLTGSLNGWSPYTQGADAGIYALNYASGSLYSAMGYGFRYANNLTALVVNKRMLTASIQNQVITYGDTTPTIDKDDTGDIVWNNLYGSDTGANIDNASFTYGGATAGATNNAGTYTLSLSNFSDNNYTLDSVTDGTLTINPYRLAVAANSFTKTAGAADPALTYTYGQLQNGDNASVFSGHLIRTPGETVNQSPYSILQGTLDAGSNYSIDFTPGSLTIQAFLPPTVDHLTQPPLQTITLTTADNVVHHFEPASINITAEDIFSGQIESAIVPAAGSDDENAAPAQDCSSEQDQNQTETKQNTDCK